MSFPLGLIYSSHGRVTEKSATVRCGADSRLCGAAYLLVPLGLCLAHLWPGLCVPGTEPHSADGSPKCDVKGEGWPRGLLGQWTSEQLGRFLPSAHVPAPRFLCWAYTWDAHAHESFMNWKLVGEGGSQHVPNRLCPQEKRLFPSALAFLSWRRGTR